MKLSYLICEPVQDITELAARMTQLAALGYQGVELTARHPFDYPLAEAAALAERFNLPIVSLLSGWSYLHEGLCLCSPSAEVRSRAVERLKDYVDAAAQLGALLVVGLMQGLRSDEPNQDLAAARIRDCLGEVAQRAAERQVNVVIEPVNHLQVGFHHTADEVASLVQHIGSPALGYMLDTIHMNIEERSMLETIRRHGPHIRHFHLCETNGGPFGGGSLDFFSVLRELNAAGYDRFVSVKIYRALGCHDVAEQAIEFVRRLGLPGEHRPPAA